MKLKYDWFFEAGRRTNLWLTRYGTAFGIALSLFIGAMTVLVNVSAGPLSNLNDIGGWRNRLLFLILCGISEALIQLLAVRLRPSSGGRMLLRQLLLVCGFHIALLAINQKTYYYTAQVQPLIRAAEGGGLSSLAGTQTVLSVPHLTLLFGLTRIPVYDLYLVKLLSIVSWQTLTLLFVFEAEKSLTGLQPEALLLFSQILPQAFLSAACAAQSDGFVLLLFAVSLFFWKRGKPIPAAAFYGFTVSLCGILLLAAPLFMGGLRRYLNAGEMGSRRCQSILQNARPEFVCIGIALIFYFLPMLPAIFMGFPAGKALTSPFTGLFGVPPYTSGSPNLMALFPRASALEMPESFLLRRLPALDLETNASPFYTQAHFEMLMRGLALTGIAGFTAGSVYAKRKTSGVRLAFILSAMALFAVPGASMALWLACDLLALFLILTDRKMRVPCCFLLFVTAAGCCYPVTEEILIRPAYTAMLMSAVFLTSFEAFRSGEKEA
ncbi:MAG: hypothetical protein K5746_08430 [Clostridiales bacterium]|nr:hypothetical protein [Clostridiales bacterium]